VCAAREGEPSWRRPRERRRQQATTRAADGGRWRPRARPPDLSSNAAAASRCAAFRGFVVPVPPPPATPAGGKTSAHARREAARRTQRWLAFARQHTRRWYIHQTRAGRDYSSRGGAEMSLPSTDTGQGGSACPVRSRVRCRRRACAPADREGNCSQTSLGLQPHNSMTQHEDSYSCRRQSTNTAVRSGGRQTVTRLNTSPGHGV